MATTNLWDYSSTAASNTSCEGENINTGMSPGLVDNGLRNIIAMLVNSFASALEGFFTGASALPIANGGTGGTTAGAARTALGLGTAAVIDETTTAQYLANAADKALSTDQVWAAGATVALTDGASVAVDMSLGLNFTLAIGGNRTLANPTNPKVGQSGFIAITQDGTGSRTLAYGANWEFANGVAPPLSTAAGTKDVLFYQVLGATSIYATLVKAVA